MVWRRRIETFVGSRDAAHALASSSPAEGTTLTKVVGVAAELARYADDSIAKVKDRYHPALDCKAGCSYCCSKPGVLTSVPDLLRILVHIRSVFSETEIAELTDRARRYAAQMQGRNCNDPTNESVPCPLLEDKRCSVYEVRPLVCRGYNSTNVNACRSAHENSTVMVPVFALIKDVTDGATVGAAQQLKEEGLNGSMVDLGSALNIAVTAGAFTDGSGFPEAIAVGDSALLPAENSSWVTELWEQVCEVARQLG
jgi:Fe-S-cluster containining protein